MPTTVTGSNVSFFETKSLAIHTPSRSPTGAQGAAPLAALVDALETSFPDTEMHGLQDVAERLARRINGPELDLTNVTDEEEDVLPLMSLPAWQALQQIAQANGGTGVVTSVALGPELSSGGPALADGLRLLGVEFLDVSVPAEGDTIDFSNRLDQGQEAGVRHLTLNIRPGEPGSTLAHIVVPEGTVVKGSWEGPMNALVHFTDAQGEVLRSARMFPPVGGGAWRQLSTIDLECVEASEASCEDFVHSMRDVHPDDSPQALSDLHARLLMRIKGPVLDLCNCVGDEADAIRTCTPGAWRALLRDPSAAELTTMNLSRELFDGGRLPVGLEQNLNTNDPCNAFVAASHATLIPGLQLTNLFDGMLQRIRGTVLDLSDFRGPLAEAVRRLPPTAWTALLSHPKAAYLASVIVDQLAHDAHLTPGLRLHLSSPDLRLSPDPRTAFIGHMEGVQLNRSAGDLFNILLERLRGKSLNLRHFRNQLDVEDLRSIPSAAWNAFLRHPRAGALASIKASPEVYLDGPLVPGLRLRLDVRDPRGAFVAAAEHAFEGRPVYVLFDVLVKGIEGGKLDLSLASADAERDLRLVPQGAWKAFLRHPQAAGLKSIIASEALFAGGPLVDGLAMELPPPSHA